MITSFIESMRYVGHLLPISLLRIYLGYFYLHQALSKLNGDFLLRPRIAAQIADWLPAAQIPAWYKNILEFIVIPNWQYVAFMIMALQFAVGISYLLGYLVRPMAVIAFFMALQGLSMSFLGLEDMQRLFMATHLTLAWVGAGRCLGVDYYFFKRRRGIWW